MEKNCRNCDSVFVKNRAYSVKNFLEKRWFCSTQCAFHYLSKEKSHKWTGGFPSCSICNEELKSRTASFCKKHVPKKKTNATTTCRTCLIQFDYSRVSRKRIFCSIACKKLGHRQAPWNKGMRRTSLCAVCPAVFFVRSNGKNLFCSRQCFGFSARGVNNPMWKGGITPEHDKIRKSDRYVKWRLSIMQRDGYTCVLCRKVGGDLQVDHIKPFAYYPELRFEESNARTLCAPCHRKTPTWGGRARSFSTPDLCDTVGV